MKTCLVYSVLLVLATVVALSNAHIQADLRRGSVKVKGVNLGGWLVAEHWMTYDSGIWQDVPIGIAQKGEYGTMQYLGHAKGDARFEQHRATWITEADIAEIARAGLNTVRVPIGYWIMGSFMPSDTSNSPNKGQWEMYAPGGLKYLDLLINTWAVRHNIAVLLSLHGHRGSQNGKDYSAPPDLGVKQWSQYPSNVENSVQWVQFLADRYRSSPAFLGMSIMNEPEYSTSRDVVYDFYRRVHHLLRSRGDDSVIVTAPMLSEQTPAFMADFLKGAKNVWHEWHPYYKWGHEGKNEEQLISAASGYSSLVTAWRGNPLLISEWSMGVWDQYAPFTDRGQFQRFGRTQLASYAPAQAGWTFWSWRHSDDTNGKRSGWSMRGLLRAGLLAV